MALGADVNVLSQVGVETTPGTSAPITKKLRGISVDLDPKLTIKEFQPQGLKFASTHVKNQEWAEAKVTGLGNYSEMHYLFSGIFRQTTPTFQQGGTTFAATSALVAGAYVRPSIANANGNIYQVTTAGTTGASEPTWPLTSGSTVVSGTVTFTQVGRDILQRVNSTAYPLNALIVPAVPNGHYYKVTTAGTSAVSPPVFTLTSGSTTTDGTAVLTEQGADIAPYLWAFDIQSEANDTVQSYTIEQGDLQRNWGRKSNFCVLKDLGIAVKRTGDYAITGAILARTLSAPGAMTVGSGITENTLLPISTQQVNVYRDTSAANIGTTQLTQAFDASIHLKDRLAPAWVLDRNQNSYLTILTKDPKLEVDLTIGDDTPLVTLLSDFAAGTRHFIRVDATGNHIANGVVGNVQWDVACQVSAAYTYGKEGEARVAKIKMQAEHDGPWGRATQAKCTTVGGTL